MTDSMVVEPQAVKDPSALTRVLDVLVIGGGFSGIYQLDQLRDRGVDVKVWDAAGGFGGVWWWNCYPGARTDSMAHIYQFSHKDLWKKFDFSELYPDWEGVRTYFEYLDEQLDLSKDIEFSTFAESASWNEENRLWTVTSSDGKVQQARIVLVATGFASKPLYPNIEGLADFQGESYHTARWPQEGVDMTDKKVVVLGTGASGVQVIQEAAAVAKQVTVLQRTPNLAVPMRQRALDAEDNDQIREHLPERLDIRSQVFAGFDFDFHPENALDATPEEREAFYEKKWQEGGFQLWLGLYQDVIADEEANRTFYDFWRDKVHQRVDDPAVAELLAPKEPPHPYGVKRPSLEQNYFDVYNQNNVRLINQKTDPIRRITATSVQTEHEEIECDILVLATGFDANSGGINAIDIRGSHGVRLSDKWQGGIDTYYGLSTNGFPNLMFLYGPQSPSGFCNGPTSAEHQGEMVLDFIEHLRTHALTRFESTEEVEKHWRSHVDEVFEASLFPKANSWYWSANVPGKKGQMLNYPGGVPNYFAKWQEIVEADYPGYIFD